MEGLGSDTAAFVSVDTLKENNSYWIYYRWVSPVLDHRGKVSNALPKDQYYGFLHIMFWDTSKVLRKLKINVGDF